MEEVKSLNEIAYKAAIGRIGLRFMDIKKGEQEHYCYIERDGTLTNLGRLDYSRSDCSDGCGYMHDGGWWVEELKFENTDEERYHIRSHGSGCSGSWGKLPIIKMKK
jgi:hypothetical protein